MVKWNAGKDSVGIQRSKPLQDLFDMINKVNNDRDCSKQLQNNQIPFLRLKLNEQMCEDDDDENKWNYFYQSIEKFLVINNKRTYLMNPMLDIKQNISEHEGDVDINIMQQNECFQSGSNGVTATKNISKFTTIGQYFGNETLCNLDDNNLPRVKFNLMQFGIQQLQPQQPQQQQQQHVQQQQTHIGSKSKSMINIASSMQLNSDEKMGQPRKRRRLSKSGCTIVDSSAELKDSKHVQDPNLNVFILNKLKREINHFFIDATSLLDHDKSENKNDESQLRLPLILAQRALINGDECKFEFGQHDHGRSMMSNNCNVIGVCAQVNGWPMIFLVTIKDIRVGDSISWIYNQS